MPWFDKFDAKIPESLRNLTPEQLEAAVKFYETNKDKIGTMETELGTTKQTLATMENEFNATKTKLADLEANAQAAREAAATAGQQPQPGPNAQIDFFTDPEGAYAQRTRPLADFAMATAATTARMSFENWIRDNPGELGDNPKIYRKYQSEVVALMSREPAMNQANPQSWFNAFVLIKGNHDADIHKARSANDGAFFGETPTVKASEEPDRSKEITEADRKAAERFGIKPEQVVESRNSLTMLGG